MYLHTVKPPSPGNWNSIFWRKKNFQFYTWDWVVMSCKLQPETNTKRQKWKISFIFFFFMLKLVSTTIKAWRRKRDEMSHDAQFFSIIILIIICHLFISSLLIAWLEDRLSVENEKGENFISLNAVMSYLNFCQSRA